MPLPQNKSITLVDPLTADKTYLIIFLSPDLVACKNPPGCGKEYNWIPFNLPKSFLCSLLKGNIDK